MDTGIDTMLFIDDDEIDTELALKTIRTAAPSLNVVTMTSGTEALNYLFPLAPAVPAPHLMNLKIVLLDLHMPGIDGIEVLKRLKRETATQSIPVVIFTSSREAKDIETCYRYGANSYIVKPIGTDHYDAVVSNVVRYWSAYNETVKEQTAMPAIHW